MKYLKTHRRFFFVWITLLTLLTACTFIVGPKYEVLFTAYVLQNTQVDSIDNEVIFRASVEPAEQIFWQVNWIDFDLILDYGQSSVNIDAEKKTTINVPVRYNKDMRFHIEFLAWVARNNVVVVTFMNTPEETQ